jgi:hypothetical protein
MTEAADRPVHRQFLDVADVGTWSDLQVVMSELGTAAPYWRVQSTQGEAVAAEDWMLDWDRTFRLTEYKYIEWCELMPRQDGAGLTLPDLLAVCQAIGFQLEELPDRVRVLGYRLLS